MQDFINPKSMMTPGIAGATMMFIVNGVVLAFPELQARIVALVISFVIGSIVFASQNQAPRAIWAKGAYWVINSLIIFVIGFGTNNLVVDASLQSTSISKSSSFAPSLINSAFAQPVAGPGGGKQAGATVQGLKGNIDTEEKLKREREENAQLRRQLEQLQTNTGTARNTGQSAQDSRQRQDSQFFRKW